MLSQWWICGCLSLCLIIGQNVRASWPVLNTSNIQLLGVFSDTFNDSQSEVSSSHSHAMFMSAIFLSHQYNITIGGQLIGWQSIHTGGDPLKAFLSSCFATSTSNIVGIVGPEYSRECHIIAPFAGTTGLPAISYSSTDPELSDRGKYPTFYRTVPSDGTAALALFQLFRRYNWTSCVIIYQDDAFGSGGVKAISEVFSNNGLVVTNRISFNTRTLRIQGDLENVLMTSSARIVILWATPDYIPIILQNAYDSDTLGPRFMWILSSTTSLNDYNEPWHSKLVGMFSIESVVGSAVGAPINRTLFEDACKIWQKYEPRTFPGLYSIDNHALFAFDATWALIQALQNYCSIDSNNLTPCISFTDSSSCLDRRLLNSNRLLENLITNRFLGVSGYVQFSENVTDRINGTYYILKNIKQSLDKIDFAPVSVWSERNGWSSHALIDDIIWPGNSLTPPTGFASVSGVILRIAITEAVPFTIVTQALDDNGEMKTNYVGYMPDLIELLQQKMGFIPKITLVSNRTFNQIIDDVADGVYDMFIAQTTVTSRRRGKVAFSNSIFDNSLRVIARKESKVTINIFAYLSPFSTGVWLVLLGAWIIAGFLFFLVERRKNEELKERSLIFGIFMSLWYSFGNIIGYGTGFYSSTSGGRIITMALYILGFVLIATYTATLASDLTVLKTKDIISVVDDMKNVKIKSNRIGILVGTAFEEYYLREISGGVRNFYPIQKRQDIFDLLLNNIIDASILDASTGEYVISNIYCNLTLVGPAFDRTTFGIVFQKNYLYQQQFDLAILSMRETGIFDDLRRKWFQIDRCSRAVQVESTSVSIEYMAGVFVTFGLILLLVCFLKVIIKYRRIKSTQQRNSKDKLSIISQY